MVAVQAVLIVAVLLTPGGDDWPVPGWLAALATAGQIAGAAVLVVAAVNLGRSLTALPNPTGRSTLKTGGLYRWARHPIYSGVIALMAGTAAKWANTVAAVLTAALVLLLAGKARWEERMLRDRYPGYAAYAEQTRVRAGAAPPATRPQLTGERRWPGYRRKQAGHAPKITARDGMTPATRRGRLSTR